MINSILVELSDPRILPFNKREALRYLGVKDCDEALNMVLEEMIKYAYDLATPKASYIKLPIVVEHGVVDLGFDKIESKALSKNLSGCNEAYVFVATIGLQIDQAIERLFRIDRAKGVILDSVSSTLIESFCNYVNDMFKKDGSLCPRFSPGYGDCNIRHQKSILNVLDAYRKTGVSLLETCMMVPFKTVTAFVGIKEIKE